MGTIPGDFLPSDDESYELLGRKSYLDLLRERICRPRTQIVQITGPPMIGKTRTAKELVRQCLQHFSDSGIKAAGHFVSARKCDSLEPIFLKLKVAVNCPAQGSVLEYIKAKTKDSLLLLLLDNVEDLLDHGCQDRYMALCQDIIHCSHDVKLVTTSRRNVMFPRLKPEQNCVSPLPPLDRMDACDLLMRVVNAGVGEDGDTSVCIGQKMALDIVDQCSCFPLVIITTGCVIRNRDYEPEEILQLMQDKEDGGILTLANDDRYAPEDRAPAILEHYTERLEPSLKGALANLSEIPGRFSPCAAAAVNGCKSEVVMKSKVLIPLEGRHVVTYDRKEKKLDIAPIIREFIEKNFETLKDPQVMERFCNFFENRFTNALSEYDKDTEAVMSDIAEDYLKYVKVLQQVDCEKEESFTRSLELLQTGEAALLQLFPKDAEGFLQRLLAASAMLGNPQQQARLLMAYSSHIGYGLGRHEEAAEHFERARQLIESSPEKDDKLSAKLYHHIGSNLFHREKRDEAICQIEKSQALLRQCDPTSRLISSNDSLLGMTYTLLGEHILAEKHHLLALEARQKMWGDSHPYVGMSVNNLALVYANQGYWERALPLFEKGLQIKRQASGGMATHTVTISLVNVSAGYLRKGKKKKVPTATLR